MPLCSVVVFLQVLLEILVGENSAKKILFPKPHNSSDFNVEYVFVDFNAWEYCATDELWAGLIRGVYLKVEKKFAVEKESIKLQWRVQRAVDILKEEFGGTAVLFARLFILTVVIAALFIFVVFSYYFETVTFKIFEFNDNQFATIASISSSAYYLWTTCNEIFQSAEMDRGQAIYSEANSVKDKIGFMAKVRKELSELFKFINNDFKDLTHKQLRLVLFIDDLDRCLGGRNVKMLEAIQLLLNVPGAPVFIFLAIDSRVVVASIEQHLNKSLKLEDAIITGWEYLEKIVQIPFCIPEISPENTTRFVSSIVKKNVKPATIVAIIRNIKNHYRFLKNKYEVDGDKEKFDLWCELPITVIEGENVGGVILSAEEFIEALSNIDERNAIFKLQSLIDILKFRLNNGMKFLDAEREEILCQQAEALLNRCTFFYAKTEENPTSPRRHDKTAAQQGRQPTQTPKMENHKRNQKSSKIRLSVANLPEKKLDDRSVIVSVNRDDSVNISQKKQILRSLEALPRKGLSSTSFHL